MHATDAPASRHPSMQDRAHGTRSGRLGKRIPWRGRHPDTIQSAGTRARSTTRLLSDTGSPGICADPDYPALPGRLTGRGSRTAVSSGHPLNGSGCRLAEHDPGIECRGMLQFDADLS
jgi:hypothetical protein